jgi:hypothetical protein
VGDVGVSNDALGIVIGVAFAARVLSITAMAVNVIFLSCEIVFIKLLG